MKAASIIRYRAKEAAPNAPAFGGGFLLMRFSKFGLALELGAVALSDAGGEKSTCSIAGIRECEDLEKKTAVVDFSGFARGEEGKVRG